MDMVELYETLTSNERGIGYCDIKIGDSVAILIPTGEADILTVDDVGLVQLLASDKRKTTVAVAMIDQEHYPVSLRSDGSVHLKSLMPVNGKNSRLPYCGRDEEERKLLGPLAGREEAYWAKLDDRRITMVKPKEMEWILKYAPPRA